MKTMKSLSLIALLGCLLLFHQACSNSSSLSSLASSDQSASGGQTEGGHEHGNGGDDTRYTNSAWFGKAGRPVNYCVQVTSDFPAPREQVLKTLDSALADWFSILSNIKVYSFSLVSKNYVLTEDCSDADLKILLGGAAVAVGKSKVGHSFRESFSLATNWSRGSIWLSSQSANWNENFRLKGALLHLLGETFGFAAVHGTIMDPQWEQWLTQVKTSSLESKLANIEYDRVLTNSWGIYKGKFQVDAAVKRILGLNSDSSVEDIQVDNADLKLTIQSQTFRYVSSFSRQIIHGDQHRVVYFNDQVFYNWMKLIPNFVTVTDSTQINVIQLIDLPGRPQLIMELNGDQAVKLLPLD